MISWKKAIGIVLIAVSVVTFAAGFVVALKLSGDPEEKPAAAA